MSKTFGRREILAHSDSTEPEPETSLVTTSGCRYLISEAPLALAVSVLVSPRVGFTLEPSATAFALPTRTPLNSASEAPPTFTVSTSALPEALSVLEPSRSRVANFAATRPSLASDPPFSLSVSWDAVPSASSFCSIH